ncbi:MAG: hypothetical protein HQM03_16470 [Magnetococcales bacterium]|nr:hypothetical protein [Magnetococcales bacterium]
MPEAPQARRKILLVLHAREPEAGVLATARSMMERLEAEVEILMRSEVMYHSTPVDRFLEEVTSSGGNGRLLYRPDLSWDAVVRHAGALSSVVCIVVESLEKWGLKNDRASRRPPPWSNRLPCPLVVAGAAGNHS